MLYDYELPAKTAETIRMLIARRIILTSSEDSSTPVMRMLMTMLLMLMILQQLQRGLVCHLYRMKAVLYDPEFEQCS